MKSKFRSLAVATALLGTLFTGCYKAEDLDLQPTDPTYKTQYIISGTVTDENGAPIKENVTVDIKADDAAVEFTSASVTNGAYYSQVKDGTKVTKVTVVTATFSAPSYETVSAYVVIAPAAKTVQVVTYNANAVLVKKAQPLYPQTPKYKFELTTIYLPDGTALTADQAATANITFDGKTITLGTAVDVANPGEYLLKVTYKDAADKSYESFTTVNIAEVADRESTEEGTTFDVVTRTYAKLQTIGAKETLVQGSIYDQQTLQAVRAKVILKDANNQVIGSMVGAEFEFVLSQNYQGTQLLLEIQPEAGYYSRAQYFTIPNTSGYSTSFYVVAEPKKGNDGTLIPEKTPTVTSAVADITEEVNLPIAPVEVEAGSTAAAIVQPNNVAFQLAANTKVTNAEGEKIGEIEVVRLTPTLTTPLVFKGEPAGAQFNPAMRVYFEYLGGTMDVANLVVKNGDEEIPVKQDQDGRYYSEIAHFSTFELVVKNTVSEPKPEDKSKTFDASGHTEVDVVNPGRDTLNVTFNITIDKGFAYDGKTTKEVVEEAGYTGTIAEEMIANIEALIKANNANEMPQNTLGTTVKPYVVSIPGGAALTSITISLQYQYQTYTFGKCVVKTVKVVSDSFKVDYATEPGHGHGGHGGHGGDLNAGGGIMDAE